jgi:hypothetical protein
MSQENVELVKALYPQPDVDMAELVRNEHTFAVICEAISPLLTDDFHVVDVLPGTTRTYAGLEGFRQNWLDWLEPWATYRSTIDEAIDRDFLAVFSVVTCSGRPTATKPGCSTLPR